MIHAMRAADGAPGDPRVLILSASIGEGHDLPARILAAEVDGLGGDATVCDGLAAMGSIIERVVLGGSTFESRVGNVAYDISYALITHVAPTRWVFGRLGESLGRRGLLAVVDAARPDVVVSTYPGARQRRRGHLFGRGDVSSRARAKRVRIGLNPRQSAAIAAISGTSA